MKLVINAISDKPLPIATTTKNSLFTAERDEVIQSLTEFVQKGTEFDCVMFTNTGAMNKLVNQTIFTLKTGVKITYDNMTPEQHKQANELSTMVVQETSNKTDIYDKWLTECGYDVPRHKKANGKLYPFLWLHTKSSALALQQQGKKPSTDDTETV